MGHNISQRKMLSQARALALGQFRGQTATLSVTCGACDETRQLRLSALCERHGPDLLLGTVVAKLSCRRCHAEPTVVKLHADDRGLMLKGPGAYQ